MSLCCSIETCFTLARVKAIGRFIACMMDSAQQYTISKRSIKSIWQWLCMWGKPIHWIPLIHNKISTGICLTQRISCQTTWQRTMYGQSTHSLHSHLKLLLKSSLLSVIVHYWQDINHIYQFILWHTGVAKQECVMNGFVDEHVLVLHAEGYPYTRKHRHHVICRDTWPTEN